MKQKYDVFISYRRDGGESTAKMLRDRLDSLGYRVFFDVESLRSGNFNTALFSVIEECSDFLLVLSPGALDRCQNEEDWVRLEIEHALSENRNIVPVMLRGFSFPEELPASIDAVRYKNGVESNYQFFDAFIQKLQSFLQAKPGKKSLFARSFGRSVYLSWGALLAVLAVVAVIFIINRIPRGYPRTNGEKNVTGNLLYYVETNLQQMEIAAQYLDDSYQACGQYLTHTGSFDSLLADLNANRRKLEQIDTDYGAFSVQLQTQLEASPFSAADAAAMHDYLESFIDGSIDSIRYMSVIMEDTSPVDKRAAEDVLRYYREILNEELKMIAANTNELLLPVQNESVLEDFKYRFLAELYYIPLQASDWSQDEKVLRSAGENSWNRIQRIENQIAALVGDDNLELMRTKDELVARLMEEGASREEARQLVEGLSGKIQIVGEKEQELEELQQELLDKYEEAREKFAPSAGDDSGILWGKMLRFLHLSLYDEALECIGFYREKVRSEDENAEKYCAAATLFIRNISRTGIDYGALVACYEPDRPHGQFLIGDVIIAVNGAPCYNGAEYAKLREEMSAEEGFVAVVLRESAKEAGKLEQIALEVEAGAPKVGLLDMTEKERE